MTRDEVIEIVHGMPQGMDADDYIVELVTRVVGRAVQKEKEKLTAWMIEQGHATGHGDSVVDLLQELEWQVAEREREACAKVCDDLAAKDKLSNYYAVAARAIRANRSQTATSVFISNGVKE